jgi:hypothetical protein
MSRFVLGKTRIRNGSEAGASPVIRARADQIEGSSEEPVHRDQP